TVPLKRRSRISTESSPTKWRTSGSAISSQWLGGITCGLTKASPPGWDLNVQPISTRNGKSGFGANFLAIRAVVQELPRKQRWKATRARLPIRSNNQSRLRQKPTARSTISRIRKVSPFYECWRVFWGKTCFGTEFGVTSPPTCTQTPPRLICGTRFLRFQANPLLKSQRVGSLNRDFPW